MLKQTEVLALIPARGGSKSIPRKNVLPLAGYPLISYSIAAALKAELVTRVIVSTDDEEIAALSRIYGAETPFLRPAEYAADNTTDLPVFEHALKWLAANEGYEPQIVVQLRPTSPFRKVWHIDQAVSMLIERPEADAVRHLIEPFQNPFKMWTVDPEGFMQPLMQTDYEEPYNMPRQALPRTYWQTGYVDAVWADTILEKHSMTGDNILPLITDPSDWVDIDSPDDWTRAERLIQHKEITFNDLGFQIRELNNE